VTADAKEGKLENLLLDGAVSEHNAECGAGAASAAVVGQRRGDDRRGEENGAAGELRSSAGVRATAECGGSGCLRQRIRTQRCWAGCCWGRLNFRGGEGAGSLCL